MVIRLVCIIRFSIFSDGTSDKNAAGDGFYQGHVTGSTSSAHLLEAHSELQQMLHRRTQERDALLRECKKLKTENKSLKKQVPASYERAVTDMKKGLEKCFTDTQINALLSNKKVANYSDTDISEAMTLHSYSSKAYNYLREKKQLPLPSVTTLNRRVSKLDIEPGVLLPVIQLLKQKTKKMSDFERLCVLSFDETSVASSWTYDKGTDNLCAPKSKLQCAMLRGLASPWKQLVYYNFDTDMTKDILFDIIVQVEEAGFLVVAMVSDMGPANVKLWRSLSVDINNTSFLNPACGDRDIFVFADAPHLIKLIRNNFLDSGIRLDGKNGCKTATNGCVREIIQRSVKDLKTTFKLSDRHVHVYGTQRMNVRLAAQLLSETTAKTLQFFGKQGLLKSKNWQTTSDFIMLSDSWFDLFNSKVLANTKSSRDAYGCHLTNQNKILNTMITTASTMRVGNKDHLYQFQKGLIISSKSLSKLYQMLKEKYNVSYLLTYRLNQDCLEHFFSCLRQMSGSWDHPSPLETKHRIKKYLLGRETHLMGMKYNSSKECEAHNISDAALATMDTNQCISQSTGNLEDELSLSAMVFAMDEEDSKPNCEEPFALDVQDPITFEDAMESESLRYVGGYVVRKFPQYQYLGSDVSKDDKTWISSICRYAGRLKTPSKDFYEQLKVMEKLFNCYHGEFSLKEEKNAVRKLAELISGFVPLPKDVVVFFVKCRVFFRIRILNRKLTENRKATKKMAKLCTKGNKETVSPRGKPQEKAKVCTKENKKPVATKGKPQEKVCTKENKKTVATRGEPQERAVLKSIQAI